MRVWTLAVAASLAATTVLAEPAFPILPPGFFQDCGSPRADPFVCRVRADLTAEEAQKRLGPDAVAVWVEGDVFTIVARTTVTDPRVYGALDAPLARLPGTDLWTISARAHNLDASLLQAGVTGLVGKQWRGPKAEPAPPRVERLSGRVFDVEFDSSNLGETRKVSVYLPPNFDPRGDYPVVYLADGDMTTGLTLYVEALILDGALRPTVMVGLHSGAGPRRAEDYFVSFPGFTSKFDSHDRFFLDEVIPRAEREWGASPRRGDRLVMGFSNGAAWAVDTALRHPGMFGNVYAVSVAGGPPAEIQPAQPIRFFLVAGTLEPFRRKTGWVAEHATAAGHGVTLKSPVAGHSQMVVEAYLDDALIAAFGPPPAR